MPGKAYGQQRQMEDPSMIGTLEAQARIIWPHEYRVLDGLGIAQCEHRQRWTRVVYVALALFIMIRNNMVSYL